MKELLLLRHGKSDWSKNSTDFEGSLKKYVSIEFSKGEQFTDPDTLLEGNGKYRRHIKLKTAEDIQTKEVEHYIEQAINIVKCR